MHSSLQSPPEENTWAKWGGIAALFEALAYVFGFLMMVFVLAPEEGTDLSHQEKLQHLLHHQRAYHLWMTIIYIFFGIALVPLIGAIQRQWRATDHPLGQCNSVFGYVWVVLVIASGMIGKVGLTTAGRLYPNDARAGGIVWTTMEAVQDGLGGGVEIVGGLWVLLVSLLAFRQAKLTPFINILGLIVGSAGVLTIVPGLTTLGVVFGLAQIVWFVSLGIHLLRMTDYNTDVGLP